MTGLSGGNGGAALPARRILVVRYRFIGDTILTVPFLRNLRYGYPDAEIDVLVGPQSGEVLESCPYVNDLIVFDTTRFHKYDRGQGKPRSFFSYAVDLRKRRYDLVFVLKRSWSSGLLAWLTGARFRVGYDTEGRGIFLTHRVAWDEKAHEVESLLNVLDKAHVPVRDTHLEAFVSEREKAEIVEMVPELSGPGRRVLIHAAAAHPAKMYPLAGWAEVIKRLHQEERVTPYFTGSAADRPEYETLQRLSGVEGKNLAGKLSIRQSLALYRHMDLACCVDSGPAHLAAAAGVPTVALFGPTDPGRWRPWGSAHRAVFDDSLKCCPCVISDVCADRPCLTRLAPDRVAAECLAILKGDGEAMS